MLCMVLPYGCVQKPNKGVDNGNGRIGNRGGKVLYQSCMLCHSLQEMQRGPILDGMESWYVLEQLEKFKKGIRGKNPNNRAEHLMGASMERLENLDEMKTVSNYVQNLPKKRHLTTIKADQKNGRLLYQKCAVCHGHDAKGIKIKKSPSLRTQEDWFLLDQLRKYKAGLRGNHPDDTYGRIMAESVKNWKDSDLKDVVVYLNNLVD